MTLQQFMALLPLVVLSAMIVVVMLVLAFHRGRRLTLVLTLAGLGASFGMLPITWANGGLPRPVTPLLIIDGYGVFFIGLILAAGFTVALLSHSYMARRSDRPGEYYLLLMLATLGSAVLAASNHFASFFLGLELLSVSLYGLVAYVRRSALGLEAGVKYLVLAATSAAFLLFGMALVYMELGTMDFAQFARLAQGPSLLLLGGLAMMVVGIGFKLAVVPFHLWTPDVYQGAPAPVTAFVATVSKGAMFALLVRLFAQGHFHAHPSLLLVFTLIALFSMFVGNLLALMQNNVKRILAYSSIAHLGYLLVAFVASGDLAVTAVTFYLLAYFVTTLGSFGVVSALSGPGRDADRLADYQGLARRRPWLAGVFTAMLLSLAGIPLTAGFIGKFFVLSAGMSAKLWMLVIVLVANSAIGLFYYLRIVAIMYMREPEEPTEEMAELAAPQPLPALSLLTGVVLAVLTLTLLWLGMYPTPAIRLIETLAAGFGS